MKQLQYPSVRTLDVAAIIRGPSLPGRSALVSHLFVLNASLFSLSAGVADDLTTESMLRELRTKDARFDNVSVAVNTTETIRRDPYAEWSNAKLVAAKRRTTPPRNPTGEEPYDIERVEFRQLTVRGDETTIETRSEQFGNGDPIGQLVTLRSSDATKSLRSMMNPQVASQDLWLGSIRRSSRFYQLKCEIRFCCGIGFGERLQSLESVEPQGDAWKVKGSLAVQGADTAEATLLIDRDLVVRHAKVVSRNQHGQWLTEVATTGLVEAPGGYRIAAAADYMSKITERIRDGVARPADRVRSKFSSDKHRLIWNLTDAKYRELVLIDESLAEHVHDYRKRKANR